MMIHHRILIVSSDDDAAGELEAVLHEDGRFTVERVRTLDAALGRLKQEPVDAVILDLSLSDSEGIPAFTALFDAVPHTPIMTLAGAGNDAVDIEAVEHGSQGYLTLGHLSNHLVPQSLRNVIQRKAVEQQFRLERARAELTLNSISDAVVSVDLQGNVDYLNAAAEAITGWSGREAAGRPVTEVVQLVDPETREPTRNPIERVLEEDEVMAVTAGTLLIRRDGTAFAIEDSASPIHDLSGKLSGAVLVFHDVTAAQEMALKMAHLAQHDFLTDLPNRMMFEDRVARAISSAKRDQTTVALFCLDLDSFKEINDTLGHAAGDELLQSVARALKGCVRDSDTVSRQGGDEFGILVPQDKSAQDAALIANKVLACLAEPQDVAGRSVHVTSSIGISVYPKDGEDAETLMKNADAAMYGAKAKGRNTYQFFDESLNARSLERQVIERDLRHALERKEFVLHYQPKRNLLSGKLIGVEALLRWVHPKRGILAPDKFLSVAEECGLIVEIGKWVLREACVQASRWRAAGLYMGSVAVNVSAGEFFRQKQFVAGVRDVLDGTRLPPHCLQLEVAESVLMQNADTSVRILEQLKTVGLTLAIDDFGVGYSNFTHLQRFQVDELKIHMSFVHAIGANGTRADSADGAGDTGGTHRDQHSDANQKPGLMACALIAMGTSFNLRVVAEGIERQEELDFLMAHECEEGQGFLLGKPVLPDVLAAHLSEEPSRFVRESIPRSVETVSASGSGDGM